MSERMTILIVEDDEKILKALSARLLANDFEVVVAMDAMNAMSQAARHKPDLVLLDISMPAGNGITVARNIQKNATLSNTRVIFMTASKDPAFKSEAMELEPVAYLEKPFESKELLDAVHEAFAQPSEVDIPW